MSLTSRLTKEELIIFKWLKRISHLKKKNRCFVMLPLQTLHLCICIRFHLTFTWLLILDPSLPVTLMGSLHCSGAINFRAVLNTIRTPWGRWHVNVWIPRGLYEKEQQLEKERTERQAVIIPGKRQKWRRRRALVGQGGEYERCSGKTVMITHCRAETQTAFQQSSVHALWWSLLLLMCPHHLWFT